MYIYLEKWCGGFSLDSFLYMRVYARFAIYLVKNKRNIVVCVCVQEVASDAPHRKLIYS